MKTIDKALIFGISAILLLLVIFWGGGNYCDYNDRTGEENCTQYETLPFIGIKVLDALDRHEGFVVGLGTLFVALFTWRLWVSTNRLWIEAQDAGKTARISADAAIESVETYKVAGRAWISYVTIDMAGFTNAKDVLTGEIWPSGMIFSIKFTNSGRTPAINCTIYSDWKGASMEDEVPIFTMQNGDTQGQAPIPPNIFVNGPSLYVQQHDIERVFTRKKRIYIYGRTIYNDIFNPDIVRNTEICIEVKCGGIRSDNFQKNFTFTAVGTQNKAT